MSDLVRNPEDRFSHVTAGFQLAKKFREKFCISPRKFGRFVLEFQICLYMYMCILYIFTSLSAENWEKFVHLGRLFLPSRPVGYSLHGSFGNSFVSNVVSNDNTNL